MNTIRYVASICIASAFIAGILMAQSQAPARTASQPPTHEHASGEAAGAPPEDSAATRDEQATLMEVEAIEAELDLLVTRMNSSEGESKLEAMADLLSTLVRQHRTGCGGTMRKPGEAAPGGCCQGAKPATGDDQSDAPEDKRTP